MLVSQTLNSRQMGQNLLNQSNEGRVEACDDTEFLLYNTSGL